MSYFRATRVAFFVAIFLLLANNLVFAGLTDQPKQYDADREVTINFKGLKISDLIDITSKLLNRNILLTKPIGGKVDFIANRPLTQSDALDILMYTLEAKGYTIVDSGNMLRVVKISDASKYNLPIQTDDVKYPKQELVTQVFSINDVSVDYIASKIRHFMSRSAKLVTDKETNSMILTDFASNIKTIQIAISILSRDHKKVIKVVKLKNIQAAYVVPELKKVAKAIFNQKIAKEKVTILANKDTNSVMFVGTLKNVNYMSDYLQKIEDSGSLSQKSVEIIALKNGDAKNAFKVIGGIIGNKKYKNPDEKPFVSLDDETNSIIIRGPKSEISFIKSMIEDLDIDKQQVYVKVKIIEVSESGTRKVGLKYGLIAGGAGKSGLATLSANLGGKALAVAPSSLGLNVPTNLQEGLALGAALDLLETNGAAETLSSPLLLCINNKESSIYAGSTKTIKIGSSTTTGGTTSDKFKREDIGLTLKIKPRISTGNKVRLDISLVLEDVEPSQTNGQPDTSKKEIFTTAIVNDGESVILGGYTREKSFSAVSKVPVLGDIPLLGGLFRSKNKQNDKINLVAIITPYIVPKTKDLTYIRNKLSQLKLLEDRYAQITLLRLEQQRLKNQELEIDTKEKMLDVADDLLDNSEDIRDIDEDLQEYLNDMEGYDPIDKQHIQTMFNLKDKPILVTDATQEIVDNNIDTNDTQTYIDSNIDTNDTQNYIDNDIDANYTQNDTNESIIYEAEDANISNNDTIENTAPVLLVAVAQNNSLNISNETTPSNYDNSVLDILNDTQTNQSTQNDTLSANDILIDAILNENTSQLADTLSNSSNATLTNVNISTNQAPSNTSNKNSNVILNTTQNTISPNSTSNENTSQLADTLSNSSNATLTNVNISTNQAPSNTSNKNSNVILNTTQNTISPNSTSNTNDEPNTTKKNNTSNISQQ